MKLRGLNIKTFAGLIGWCGCMLFTGYTLWADKDFSAGAELFMVLSCALLGIDILETLLLLIGRKSPRSENESNNETEYET